MNGLGGRHIRVLRVTFLRFFAHCQATRGLDQTILSDFIPAERKIPPLTHVLPRVVFIALILLPFAGCGIAGLCTNSCPAGWVHGSADCGCMQTSKVPGRPPPSAADHYMIRRYYCTDNSNCTVTASANTCDAARQAILDQLQQVRDPCYECSGIITDGRSWNGKAEYIQDGPCRGWSNVESRFRKVLNYSPMPKDIPAQEYSSHGLGFSGIRLRFASNLNHILRVTAARPTDNSIETCQQECAASSPYCLRVRIPALEQTGLRGLQQLLQKEPQRVAKSEMLSLFNMDEDKCQRGDTIIDAGHVSNLGEQGSCKMTTTIPDSNISLNIVVPELLRGIWKAGPGRVETLFDDPETRASLHFSDSGLEMDWGGDIVAAYSDGNFIGFSVGDKSCVRANLD